MPHKDHEARVRILGAIELDAAAYRLELIRTAYEKEGASDIGVVLTPWIQKIREGAAEERSECKRLVER